MLCKSIILAAALSFYKNVFKVHFTPVGMKIVACEKSQFHRIIIKNFFRASGVGVGGRALYIWDCIGGTTPAGFSEWSAVLSLGSFIRGGDSLLCQSFSSTCWHSYRYILYFVFVFLFEKDLS